jgi:hypothetical protein
MDRIYYRLTMDPDSYVDFWSYVTHGLKWKGPVSMLQQRFIKLYHLKGLSIREKIFLKKLYDKKKGDPKINVDSFLYHFPGRTLNDLSFDNLDVRIAEYFQSYKNPEYGQIIKYNTKIFQIQKMTKSERRVELSRKNEFKIMINLTGCESNDDTPSILPHHKDNKDFNEHDPNAEAFIVD